MKPNPMDDLHFRLDEHERALSGIGKAMSPEIVGALVSGAVEALHAAMKAEIHTLRTSQASETEKLMQAITADAETDRAVIASIERLIEAMNRPTTKTGTLDLPSGEVKLRIVESR